MGRTTARSRPGRCWQLCPLILKRPFEEPVISSRAIRRFAQEIDSRAVITQRSRGWLSEGWFGLDQGLLVMMIENHRSGLIWEITRQCPVIRAGLIRAGFTGGWL